MIPKYFLFSILFLVFSCATAQLKPEVSQEEDLYKEIFHMDSLVFNAFNTRNIDQFKSLFTDDLEFYHDKGGLTGYVQTIDFLKTTADLNNHLKRELLNKTLEVYPIPGYGAMEIGLHRFCHIENAKKDCGTFKFIHIWKKTNDEWKITRVISYGH